MKQIVERILKQEASAQQQIAQAGRQAQDIIAQAHKQSQQIVEDALREADSFIALRKEQSQQEFLQQKDNQLKQLQQQILAKKQAKEVDIPHLAGKIFLQITNIQE